MKVASANQQVVRIGLPMRDPSITSALRAVFAARGYLKGDNRQFKILLTFALFIQDFLINYIFVSYFP